MTFDPIEYRKRNLIQDFLISAFHKTCLCSDTYSPCRRCKMLDEAEELFPEEYRKCASAVARNKGDRK